MMLSRADRRKPVLYDRRSAVFHNAVTAFWMSRFGIDRARRFVETGSTARRQGAKLRAFARRQALPRSRTGFVSFREAYANRRRELPCRPHDLFLRNLPDFRDNMFAIVPEKRKRLANDGEFIRRPVDPIATSTPSSKSCFLHS